MGFAAPGPYRIPNVRVDSYCVYTNLPPNGAFRGYGQMQSAWASERAMDLLADRLGLDPLELRLRNLLREGDRYCTGETMHDVHFAECLEAAADADRLARGPARQGAERDPEGDADAEPRVGRDRGRGTTAPTRCAARRRRWARARSTRSRSSRRSCSASSRPRSASPIRTPTLVPYDTRTTSSRSTYMMSRALEAAAADLRQNGKRGFGEVVDEGGLDPDTGQGIASTHWHQGAAAAEVRVDEETGKIEVVRLHASIYAGRVVDRPAAELQTEGSMIMGLGTALFEEVVYRDGQVVNANLSDYPVPAFADLPGALTYELIEREGAEIHGLGETALPPVPPAIGNALASLGRSLTDLPMTPERVLGGVDAAAVKVALPSTASRTRSRRAPTSRCSTSCAASSACSASARRAGSASAAPARCSSTARRCRAACCWRRSPRAVS